MAEPQKVVRFNLPDDFDSSDRIRAATLIKKIIVERTESGIDKDGKAFADYSDDYVNSREFAIAGKTEGSVDLTLTGDMLNSILTLNHDTGYVDLGYKEGTFENDKAVWNERNQGVENKRGPARKFLGILDEELELVIAEVRSGKGDEPNKNNANETANEDEKIKAILRKAGL